MHAPGISRSDNKKREEDGGNQKEFLKYLSLGPSDSGEAHSSPCSSAGGTQLGRALALLNSVRVLHTNFRSSASWGEEAGGIHPYASDAWHRARTNEKIMKCLQREWKDEPTGVPPSWKSLRTLLLHKRQWKRFVNWTRLQNDGGLYDPKVFIRRCLFGTHCVCTGENTEWKMHRMQIHGDKGPGA